ncbi:ribbon-helix-helix protein, CopG family [Cerasicoccus frondis]|uniref:ribbon-helix-helix protein, CopG family n=1 Tax=Cerasicoccus frondis TaxID=490090 RepID=UPI00285289AB|nr:ribbon-helix-helix protein, CopG family [Cerasicoccus frondis]
MAKKKTVKRAAKKAAKKSAVNRAAGKTQISISLPQELVHKIDMMAAAENRNRSNFIATALENLTEQ